MPDEDFSQDLLDAKRTLSARLILHADQTRVAGSLRRGGSRTVRAAVSHARENVNAVGIGRKIVHGKPTGEPCVRIYVTEKLPRSLLPGRALLPEAVDGIPTDVIESPPAFIGLPAAASACSLKRAKRQRPVQGGISAGHRDVTAGTIACFCRSTAPGEDPRQLLVLSNNHVFANVDAGRRGDPLLQPARADGGSARDAFATLLRSVPIDLHGSPNSMDAAVGRVNARVRTALEICSIGTVVGVAKAREGTRVRKHGRTSGLTQGRIADVALDVVVGMDHDDPTVSAIFTDQIRIDRAAPSPVFAQGGDSGALVVSQGSKPRAVGLFFACPADGSYGLASPIGAVLSALQLTLAT